LHDESLAFGLEEYLAFAVLKEAEFWHLKLEEYFMVDSG
jgi:hypothetical protein